MPQQQPQEQCYQLLSVCAVFLCDQTIVWLPVLGFFNLCTDVDACNCIGGLYRHWKIICTRRLFEKNPLPHQGTWTQVSIVPGFSIWHSELPWPLHSNSIPYTVIVFKPGVGIKLAASSFNALKKKYWKRMTLGFAGFYIDIIWMSTSG